MGTWIFIGVLAGIALIYFGYKYITESIDNKKRAKQHAEYEEKQRREIEEKKNQYVATLIRGHEIKYYDYDHRYLVDGQQVLCVSDIVSKASKANYWDDYENVSESVLRNAADKGTAMHKVIEEYEKNGVIPNTYVTEYNGYRYLKDKHKFECLENEQFVLFCDDNDRPIYCGRLDMIISMNGKRGIGDLKRTSKLYPEKVSFQLNLYRLAYIQSYGKKVDFLKCIRLRSTVKQFVDLNIDSEYTIKFLRKYVDDFDLKYNLDDFDENSYLK